MVKKKDRQAVIFMVALGVFFLFGVLAALDVGGTFSVTGSNSNAEDVYGFNDGNDAAFTDADYYDPYKDGCSVLDVSSVRSAPIELGASEYYRITSQSRLIEINGVVYQCD